MKLITFDIETWGLEDGFTLQPWQVKNNTSGITSIVGYNEKQVRKSSFCPSNVEIIKCLFLNQYKTRKDIFYAGWNLKFDLSYLIGADLYEFIKNKKFIDGMLLLKRLNSKLKSYALKSTLERYAEHIPDYKSGYQKNIDFKIGNPKHVYNKEDQENLIKYNERDTLYTYHLIKFLLSKTTENDLQQCIRESTSSLFFAKTWTDGILIDSEAVNNYANELAEKILILTSDLKKFNLTPDIINSPKQLSEFITSELKLKLDTYTAKGAYSVNSLALKRLYYKKIDSSKKEVLNKIINYKELQTENVKFIKSAKNCLEKSDYIHPEPILSGTYTGRLTYSIYQNIKKLKVYKNGNQRFINKKLQIGIPIHQIKKGTVRSMFIPPKGYKLLELDFSAQEMRLIACLAKEETMIKLFNSNKDMHSYTAAGIEGVSYDEFMNFKKVRPDYYTQKRYIGKITNLSLQYRLSAKSLYKQWHDKYGLTDKTENDAYLARATYLRLYKGINEYWVSAVNFAKNNGYAVNKAGKKHYLNSWIYEDSYKSEQTSINYPIQSTGAEQKLLAIYHLRDLLISEDVDFKWDLHDGLFFYIPENNKTMDVIHKMKLIMSNLPYDKAWGWQPQVSFPVEAKLGSNWNNLSLI